MFKSALFEQFSISYDICVNFIDGHDEASKILNNVIKDDYFVKTILNESKQMMTGAEKYMIEEIEDMFPEISKAVQHRRAQYFILIHEFHFVEEMLNKG
jgi:hypothetical protein